MLIAGGWKWLFFIHTWKMNFICPLGEDHFPMNRNDMIHYLDFFFDNIL